MNKLTMLDYVKETPDVLKTNIEQYTTPVSYTHLTLPTTPYV